MEGAASDYSFEPAGHRRYFACATLRRGDAESTKDDLACFSPCLPEAGDAPLSRGEAGHPAEMEGAHHTFARPRRCGTLCGLLSLCGSLPCGLHFFAGH